jgi:lipoprotein-releasing system permease protein
MSRQNGDSIADWRDLTAKFRRIPHVVAVAPVLYNPVFITGPQSGKGIELKGIDRQAELDTSEVLQHLKSGSLDAFGSNEADLPGIVLGSKAALDIGVSVKDQVRVIDPQGELTPFGPAPHTQRFRVLGIFESGFYDFDDNWSYAPLAAAQKLHPMADVVNDIEIRADDPNLAPEIAKEAERLAGNKYSATNWEEQNSQLFGALQTERLVTFVTIGLIELVAALNIVIALTMIVLTKFKDIAVLMSMGARRSQIRRIFIMQGAIIGLTGTSIGLILGYGLSYFAGRYQWIALPEAIYAVSFVPFEPRLLDGVWIAAAAMTVSLLATIYPAHNATRITPVEVLRYE